MNKRTETGLTSVDDLQVAVQMLQSFDDLWEEEGERNVRHRGTPGGKHAQLYRQPTETAIFPRMSSGMLMPFSITCL